MRESLVCAMGGGGGGRGGGGSWEPTEDALLDRAYEWMFG